MPLILMLVQKYLLISANHSRTQIFLTESIRQRISELDKLGSASCIPFYPGE